MDNHLAKANQEILVLKAQLAEVKERSEKEIGQLKGKLTDIQSFVGLGWWTYHLEEQRVSWSEGMYEQFGWDKQVAEPSPQEFLEMIHPEDLYRVKQYFSSVYRQGEDSYIIRIIGKNKQVKFLKGLAKATFDENGKAVSIQGNSIEVTDIREAELDLKLEKEKYQLIINHVRDVICLHEIDGTISYLSPSIILLLGYTAEELAGTDPYQLIHPEDVERIREEPHQAAILGKTSDGVEYRIMRKDGQLIWMQASFTPIIVDGKTVGIQSISREITKNKEARDKLIASEKNYRRLASNIPDTDIFLFDLDKKVILAEGSNLKKAARSSAELEGKTLFETVDEKLALQIDPIYDLILSGESIHTDIVYNGRQYHLNGTPILDEEGKIEGGLVVNSDTTNKVQIENNIIKIKEELEDAQILSRMGNLEIDIASGKITVNNQLRRLFSLPEGFNPTLEQGLNYLSMTSRRKAHRAIKHSIKEGKGFDLQLQLSSRGQTAEWVRAIAKVVKSNGKATVIKCVFQDITKEKHIDLNVKHYQKGLEMLNMIASHSELKFEKQIDHALVEVSDYLNMTMGTVAEVNKGACQVIHMVRKETGLPDFINHKFNTDETLCQLPYIEKDIIAISDVPNSPYASLPCFARHGFQSFIGAPIWLGRNLQGTICFASLSKRSIFSNEEIDFVRLLAQWVGATLERAQHEQEILLAKKLAEKASLAKAEFLSTMSHEIRTPMNAVIGITHLLLQDDPKPDQVDNLNALRFSGENLLALINDILDFSKIEAGKIDFEEVDFSLKELTNGICQSFGFKAKEKNIGFQVSIGDNLPEVLVSDPTRLSQVLNNLLSNAIKFTEKGSVCFSVEERSRTKDTIGLYFEVKDSGIGIPTDKRATVFESFSQANTDTNRKFGGTGLGLTITKKLLELQGSQIQLESEEGKGTTFSFKLNFKIGQNTKPKIKQGFHQEENLLNSLEGYKALLVEDNAMNVIVARQFLNRWKLDFEHAENGEEAVRKVVSNRYDLVLMDLQMPIMDGYEAAMLIRQTHPELPIIALTASAMLEIQEKVYKVGMNDFVTKPFNPRELYQKISKYLSLSQIKA